MRLSDCTTEDGSGSHLLSRFDTWLVLVIFHGRYLKLMVKSNIYFICSINFFDFTQYIRMISAACGAPLHFETHDPHSLKSGILQSSIPDEQML